VAEEVLCGTAFGGDEEECKPIVVRLRQLYLAGTPEDLASACRTLPVDAFVARDTDAAWRERSSWVWTSRPEFQNEFVRIFACRPLSR
jgi:hypothetical protein